MTIGIAGIGIHDNVTDDATEVRVTVDLPVLGQFSLQKVLRGDARVAIRATANALSGVFAAIQEEQHGAAGKETG